MQKNTTLYGFLLSFFLILFQAILLLHIPVSYAGFEFDLGNFNLVLTPTVSVQEEYNDNIFLSRIVERSDWITTVSPGFSLSLLQPRTTFDLAYSPGFVYFLHNPQFDYTSHTQSLSLIHNLTPRLTFSLDQLYIRTNEPDITEFDEDEGEEVERSLQRRFRFKLNRMSFQPALEYRFGTENLLAASYLNVNSRDEDPFGSDYVAQRVNASLLYWFNVKNGINLFFRYRRGDFDEEPDLLSSYRLAGRFIHRLTPHLEVYAGGSAEFTDFEGSLEDEDIYTASSGFTYAFSPTLNADCSFGYFWRKGDEEDEDGLYTLARLTKIFKKFTIEIAWRNGYTTEYFTYRDSGSYEYWNISTALIYSHSDRLSFTLSGFYGNRDYTTDFSALEARGRDRDDNIYSTRLSINYQLLENINLNFAYMHREVDSNLPSEYYIVNRCTGQITLAF